MTKATCALIATLALATLLGAAAGPAPSFRPDPLWSQALPNKWVTGAVGGMAVEKPAPPHPPQAECCIPAPAVLQFSPAGQFIQAWGGPGQGYEWFVTQHGIFVDTKDNVWLSGSAKEANQL